MKKILSVVLVLIMMLAFVGCGEEEKASVNGGEGSIEGDYKKAVALMEEGKYAEAIVKFEELDGYKNSEKRITECENAIKYNDAVDLMDASKYTEAINLFQAISTYKDAAEKIDECNMLILDGKYNDAIVLMNEGKYREAMAAFENLGEHKDSTNKIDECYAGIYGEEVWGEAKNINAGDTYVFGSYEQDNNITNGKEKIEWQVLKREETKIFIVSKYILDFQMYNIIKEDITWENCSLRSWLNNDFVNTAFSENEKTIIPTVTVSADENPYQSTNPGNDTQDKVFLLSVAEIDQYLGTDSAARICECTDYVKENAKGFKHNNMDYSIVNNYGNGAWCTRTPGNYQNTVATCSGSEDYDFKYGGIIECFIGVRPAMWIDLSKIQ